MVVHFPTVSIQCDYGEIRLVDGTTLQEGRLELCINSSWGTVCHDNWGVRASTSDASHVVCRQLRYKENGEPISITISIIGSCY